MKTGRRPRLRRPTLEEEQRMDKTILRIGALCYIDHSNALHARGEKWLRRQAS